MSVLLVVTIHRSLESIASQITAHPLSRQAPRLGELLVQQNHGLFQTQFSAKALSGAGASPYQHSNTPSLHYSNRPLLTARSA